MRKSKEKPETEKILQKKARKKYLSASFALHLYNSNKESSCSKGYWNSYYCANVLVPNVESNKLTTHYCKNRWCPLCSSIRIAKLINDYEAELKALDDPYFITLTLPTCEIEKLPGRIKSMNQAFRKIVNGNKRGRGMKGIRKCECTLRPLGLYHFHYHVIVSGKDSAEYIVKSWLRLFPEADANAQDYKPVTNRENSMLELFKYFTKLVSKEIISDKKVRRYVDYGRLDQIFQALKGTRVYQSFGKWSKPADEDFDENELVGNLEVRADSVFKWIMHDWVNVNTGECLSGYNPSESLKALVEG